MTALHKYEKLESAGLWRESLATQRREVFVSFGDTSLVIRDRLDAPISHWSLPAVVRLNPGDMPALYSPNSDANETLEISDPTMVAAVEKVRTVIDRRRPHPGRLRLAVFLALTAVIAALGVFWLPGALERHTVRVVPFETRHEIGRQLLDQINRLTGAACSTAAGDRALGRLKARLLGGGNAKILVLGDGIADSTHLPGGFILLNRNLVEDFEAPEIAAGYVLLEQIRAQTRDPLAVLLHEAGVVASFRLLTTGEMKAATLARYANHLLVRPNPLPSDAVILSAFAKARISSSALAYSIDITGETTLGLIEADPFRNKTYPPVLSDASWVGLQAICGG